MKVDDSLPPKELTRKHKKRRFISLPCYIHDSNMNYVLPSESYARSVIGGPMLDAVWIAESTSAV